MDSLQAPFEAKRDELKQEIAQTFVPAMRHVHGLHKVLNERVDVTYGKGLKFFNDACKDLEAATLAEYQELVDAYEKTRVNMHYISLSSVNVAHSLSFHSVTD